MSFNLATILTETTATAPDAPACRFRGTTTTYRELDELSGLVAAGLQSAGLAPGQVVALQLPNLPHFLIAYFGALKAGLVVLPLNPLLMAPELEYHLTDSGAALLVGFEGMHAEASKACETTGVPLYLVSMDRARGPKAPGRSPSCSAPRHWTSRVGSRAPPTTRRYSSTPAAPRASQRGPSLPISSCT